MRIKKYFYKSTKYNRDSVPPHTMLSRFVVCLNVFSLAADIVYISQAEIVTKSKHYRITAKNGEKTVFRGYRYVIPCVFTKNIAEMAENEAFMANFPRYNFVHLCL